MTTDENIDTATKYISMKDSDGSRSIAELVEEEHENGYSGMTDVEIKKLITYHTHIAEQSELIKNAIENNNKQQQILIDSLAEQAKKNEEFFNNLACAKPLFATVDGSEVN